MSKIRCGWVKPENELYLDYHDKEWGVPVHNDKILFEFLVLESFQAGLSWELILKKRENFRKAFANFEVEEVARFQEKKILELLNDASIVRNKLKINATINNAQKFIAVQEEFGSFDRYIWRFIDGKPIVNKWKTLKQVPANTALSDKISKDLKQRGFKFLGTTVVYSHLQATGLINDHIVECFRYEEIIASQT
ncbi:MAG: DNA-3-methyladenine glycosylase I [Proteobacteria bacterium]|nr:DNA-3-methyladenine glycosylase I [Pseudomonadota bacterium]